RVRGGGRVEVEGLLLNVGENRLRSLIEDAVGRGDETEGAGHHLVALAPPQHPHPEVQRGGTARGHHRVRNAEPGGELALEALPDRPERELPRAQYLEDQLLLAAADIRLGQRDLKS